MKSRQTSQLRAVVLAGGRGTRLAPYTTVLPKPLMPVGDMPILEFLILRLREHGITSVTIAVGHLASLIQAYFGDGSKWGVQIDYSMEQQPLGTAGPLRLATGLNQTFLLMNGDLLTDLDFGAFHQAHLDSGAAATVGVYERDYQVELGVIEMNDIRQVTGYVEKPVYRYRASMGVYVLEPHVVDCIPPDRPFDLPDLIRALMAKGEPVSAYVHSGYWLDIGRPEDYQRAQADVGGLRDRMAKGGSS